MSYVKNAKLIAISIILSNQNSTQYYKNELIKFIEDIKDETIVAIIQLLNDYFNVRNQKNTMLLTEYFNINKDVIKHKYKHKIYSDIKNINFSKHQNLINILYLYISDNIYTYSIDYTGITFIGKLT